MYNEDSVKEELDFLIGDQFAKTMAYTEDVDNSLKLNAKKFNK